MVFIITTLVSNDISNHNPIAVIPGRECAVALSEWMAWEIGLEGNDPATTALRRNKYLMNQAVERIVKGAGHTELILAEDGATLIEIGARVSGAANPKAIRLATGSDQLELMRFAYTRPDLFELAVEKYTQSKLLRCIHSVASQRKPFSHAEFKGFLNTLPGFVSVIMKIANNTLLSPTIDVTSCPAAFFITGDNKDDIQNSYDLYRKWESENL